MDPVCVSPTANVDEAERLAAIQAATKAQGDDENFIRIEANFLRLPLFAIDNKHMRTMDAIRCDGTYRRGDRDFTFTYSATRNAGTLYPGPLARAAHFALLNIATARGLPFENPITFTWRELCGVMGISPSGKTVAALRDALTATKGLMIESQNALFSKAENAPLSSEKLGKVFGLYDELEFYGCVRQDGTTADLNAVFLARWYIDNLNALYSAPLDYTLWRSLNYKSPISSRLYEFLFFKFYGGQEWLRFNYSTLVKFIPARTERYLSDAKKQLGKPLSLLVDARILANVQWVQSTDGSPQLLLRRGEGIATAPAVDAGAIVDEEQFTIQNVDALTLPGSGLVRQFHRLWGHENFKPSKAECETAIQFINRYGEKEVEALLPAVVKRMKLKWPDAKTFVAASRYLEEIAREAANRRHSEQRAKEEELARETERKRVAEQAKEQAAIKAAWVSLSPAEQEQIRKEVLASQPASLSKHPAIIDRLCLAELGKRFGA